MTKEGNEAYMARGYPRKFHDIFEGRKSVLE